MLASLRTPWWRLPVALIGFGLVVLALDILLKLGWIPYLIALVACVVGATLAARAEVDGGPRLLVSYCAGAVVLIAGVGWLHPQSWNQPGHTGPEKNAKLVARVDNRAVFVDNGVYSAWSLASGKRIWRHYPHTPVSFVGSDILVQLPGDPTKAKAYFVTNHKFDGVVAWQRSTTATAQPITAAQKALLPAVGSSEQLVDRVNDGRDAAQLVRARDFTGHHYLRLDIVAGGSLTQYRVKGATGLQLKEGVLVVDSDQPRMIPLVQVPAAGAS